MYHLSENSGKTMVSGYPRSTHNKVFSCRNFQLDLSQRTYIMGILNVTPDSFFDGGKYLNLPSALRHIERMLEEGADIVDIGGESTRPGSLGVSEDEELRRVLPVIKEAVKRFNTILSIDTTKLNVAKAALEEGVSIVNDISGLKFEPKIADLVAKHRAGLVVMHTPSRPYDMQEKTHYNSLIDDVRKSLEVSVRMAEEKGVAPESILVDPGFGFGKTVSQNLLLLKHLREFESLGKPILVGTSRKSFIGKVLGTENPQDRLEGTAATVSVAILNGASVIRVHDVLYMKRVATVVDAILRAR